MEQIAITNNDAVHLLQGEDFANFNQAESMLRKAMVAMRKKESVRGQLPATATLPSCPKQQLQLILVRRSKETISSRRSSIAPSSPAPAIWDCDSFLATTNIMEVDDEEIFECMSEDWLGLEEDENDDDDDDDDEYDTMIAIEPLELTQVDPMRGSGQHMVLPLFNRALLVDDSIAVDEEISVVLLYNLALIHHIKGLYLRRPDIVDKAVNLYELAVSILQKSDKATNSSTKGEVDELLVLALLYNLGQASAHQMKFDKAVCCFAFLRSILKDDDDEEDAFSSLDDSDYSFFFFNVMIFQDGERLPMAPAA